jgi:hypothetical protein
LSCDFGSFRAARKFGKDNASWQEGAHHWHFIGTRRTCGTGIHAEELALILAQLRDLHAIASSIFPDTTNAVLVLLRDWLATSALCLHAQTNSFEFRA